MRLQAKVNLGIGVVFGLLAAVAAVVTYRWQTDHAIKGAENRVALSIRGGWEIYDASVDRMALAANLLASDPRVFGLVRASAAGRDGSSDLDALRRTIDVDFLVLTDAQGQVVARQSSGGTGDSLATDPLVHRALTGTAARGTLLLDAARLRREGKSLLARCRALPGRPQGMALGAAAPVIEGGSVAGVVVVGRLLNGAVRMVDRIRDSIFAAEVYGGRPVGTATIFMDDLRISTNVLDEQGRRAIDTRASEEVRRQVLEKGHSWTGRAWVVNDWYLSRYDPIRDLDGRVIGMLYVGSLERQYLDQRTMAVRVQLLLVVGAMVAALALLSLLIRRTILNPVHGLLLATEGVAQGDLSHRVEIQSRDEIGDLARSFNNMGKQLRQVQEKVQANQDALDERNRELAATNRNYMDMLGFVSHEMKAPLSAATLGLHTVKGGYLGSLGAEQCRVLGAVGQNLDFLNEMVKHYLDLSRLEKGELVVRKSWVRLKDEIVDPVLDTLAASLERRGLAVEQSLAPGLRVYADPDALRVVFENLVSNAIKYGREGGRVLIGAELRGRFIALQVENDGEGIPRGQCDRLFRKFSRLEMVEETGKKGTGLGLYICREIVEQHGGTIGVESEEGRWTRFTATLPLDESVRE
jgi:two-component system NtrC family sensor kinase